METLTYAEISAAEAEQIIGYEAKFYPLVNDLGSLENPDGIGLYLGNNPVGFTYSHTFQRDYLEWLIGAEKEAKKKCGELDLIYVKPQFRNLRFGSFMFNLASQRLIDCGAELLFVHVTDRTGKVARLCLEAGFTLKGKSKKYLNAVEYEKSLNPSLPPDAELTQNF